MATKKKTKEQIQAEINSLQKELDKRDEAKEKELEAVFKEQLKSFEKELAPIEKEILAAIGKAESLSEKYGIPYCGIGPIYMNYAPDSFDKIWSSKGLDSDMVREITVYQCHMNEGGYSGWEHSAICY